MPKRIQRKRSKGWKMPPNTVYVGRPTKWGNPFTGPDAVEKYRWAILGDDPENACIEWMNAGGNGLLWSKIRGKHPEILDELRGKDLACFCPLDRLCHADILLEIVNE